MKRKIEFGRIEDVKQNHFVPPMAKMFQPGQQRADVVEQVGEDDDHASFLQPLGQVVKDRAGLRFSLGHALLHDVQELLEVRRIAAGPHQCPNLAVEGDQSDAVLLLEDEKGEGRGGALGVFEFRQRGAVAAIAHAFAGVQQQVADEVGFFLVLLEIVLVGLAENFPIDVAQIVALGILAMLGELDRETVVRTAMHAGDIAFDNQPGTQLKPLQLSERLRI